MCRAALLLLIVAACVDRPARNGSAALTPAGNSTDSAFALVQARGQAAMGVDQYAEGLAQIRSHMRRIETAFAGGDGRPRLSTSDSSAIAAIHQFLAVQRQDHRSTSHGAGH